VAAPAAARYEGSESHRHAKQRCQLA
jgi:hypothetical protein